MGGRWSLLRTPGTWGTRPDEEEHAERIARQWLDRYGIVSRDWWRRERPPVGWRAIYRELKRLEFRGEVRRGYFVEGLGGAQFALPEAVERLRAQPDLDAEAPVIVMSAADPANPYTLALESIARGSLVRPRGAGALLLTRRGIVIMNAEGRARRIAIATDASDADVTAAARLLGDYLSRSTPAGARAARDPRIREASTASPRARVRTPRHSWTRGGVARRMGWCSTGCDSTRDAWLRRERGTSSPGGAQCFCKKAPDRWCPFAIVARE